MGNRGLVQKLIGAGTETGNALYSAIKSYHVGVVNDMLEGGASVAAKDTEGNTLLHLAARAEKTEMVQLLVQKGADKDAMDGPGSTPLHLVACHSHVAATLSLQATGADVLLRCTFSMESMVHAAARNGQVESLREVIDHGADADTKNAQEEGTALHEAAAQNKTKAIDVLVEARANIEPCNHLGLTPLGCAAMSVSPEAVLTLPKHGADDNSQCSRQRTPLHYAPAQKEPRKVVDYLLRSGADESILYDEDTTAKGVAGPYVHGQVGLAEGVERVRVRELLANVPGDRTWRRRGYLVLCRTHPDRVQLVQKNSSGAAAATRGTRSVAKLARTQVWLQ